MAGSLNKVMIIGRMGRDPELTYTPNGAARCKFSMATDEGYRDKQTGQKVDKTEWHNVVAWNQTAEFCGKYLGKGRLVYVEGSLETRKWQDQNTGQDRYMTEIKAFKVQGLDSAPQQQGSGQPPQQPQPSGVPGQAPQSQGYQQPQQQPQYDQNGFPTNSAGQDDVPF